MVNQDRNTYAACMLALGEADGMVTGLTRSNTVSLDEVRRVVDAQTGRRVFGLSIVLARGRTVFVADTTVHELPTSVEMADIAVQTAEVARRLGHEPRVAMLSYSNFGNPMWDTAGRVRDAVALLDSRVTDFEYDGEMSADVALNPELRELYPFSRLSGPANVLIMPALHTANISSKLLQELGRGTVIGPILVGLSKPVQVASMGAGVTELINLAALAAHEAARG
jgi:malate dehydrogenase (oxaloacetate-decarboxylating)(NADP+)